VHPVAKPKIALVHDYMVVRGGAERVLLSLARLFPHAPIYTAIYRPETTMPEFAELDVRPLWPSRLPLDQATYRPWVLAYALAFARLALKGFDVVLSHTSGFAKSAGAAAAARVSLCVTPPRFIWPCGLSSAAAGHLERAGLAILRPWLRRLDVAAAQRVDIFAANSENTRARIRRFYGRDAEVVYPPVDTVRFQPRSRRTDSYLVVGRLVRYKRFDRVVSACNRLHKNLTVVGTGPDEQRLRGLAGSSVIFVGFVPDADLTGLYSSARALIVPGEEDLGLTNLEANACGCPVIAAARGGSLETVVDGVTGVLYDPDDENALDRALQRFESMDFSTARLRSHALAFGEDRFHKRVAELVERAYTLPVSRTMAMSYRG